MGFDRAIQAAIVRADMWLIQYGLIMVAVIVVLAVAAIIIRIIDTKEARKWKRDTKSNPKRFPKRRKTLS